MGKDKINKIQKTLGKGTLSGFIHARIAKNKNFLAVFLGPTGSGKTYSALRFAETLDPEFGIDRVAFSTIEFMKILLYDESIKSGSVIVWDETGV